MNDFFCPLPWISTSVRSDGVLRVCCHSNQGPKKGELDWSVDDIDGSRNSPRLMKIRKQILSKKWPEDCIRCKKESESGIRTRFQYEGAWWEDTINYKKASELTSNDGSINELDFPLIYYDMRFGNFCNLRCRYCSVYSSSAFGSIAGDYHWFERDEFWEHLKRNINNIKVFHIEGGEPLLIPEYYKFMELAVELNLAKNIKIESTTNLNTIPAKAWNLWKEFKEVRLGVSVDAIGKRFDYIRYPSKWKTVSQNIEILDNAEGNFVVWFATTISTLNIWYLPELMMWKIRNGFNRFSNNSRRPFFSDHPIHTPKYYNIKSLPSITKRYVTDHLLFSIQEIDKAADEFESNEKMRDAYKKSVRNLFDSYINYMNQESFSDHHRKFIFFSDKLDQKRKQSMKEHMPEWYEILRGEIK
jgi:sulfatase maturation enzyme AslB (radical SAM superfamily)